MKVAQQLAEKFGKAIPNLKEHEQGPIVDDFEIGYFDGVNALMQCSGSHAVRIKWALRGRPKAGTPEGATFLKWKQGYFVGLFHRLELDLEIHTGVQL